MRTAEAPVYGIITIFLKNHLVDKTDKTRKEPKMLYHVNGELCLLDGNIAVVDCGGVGFQMTISQTTHRALTGKYGSRVKLYTHMAVRTDAIELFGFATTEELSSFRMLTSVSGIGPKAALSILSLFTPEQFAAAVVSSDTKAIARAPGVGSKTAARVVLDLKDKIAGSFAAEGEFSAQTGGESSSGAMGTDAVNALMVLGFSRAEAITALKKVDPSLPLEEAIRQALRTLNR